MFLKQKIKLFFFKGMYVLAPVVVALGGGTASTLWMIPHSTFSPGKRLDLGQLPDYGTFHIPASEKVRLGAASRLWTVGTWKCVFWKHSIFLLISIQIGSGS